MLIPSAQRGRRHAHLSRVHVLLIALVSIGLVACSPSLRTEAAKVAKAGSATAKQMAEYYEQLQRDTVDTYELTAFREAYLREKAFDEAVRRAKEQGRTPPPPPPPSSPTDLFPLYQDTYQALAARVRLARAIQDAYDSYAHLADYDATGEVLDSVHGLITALNGAAHFALPDPTGTVTSVAPGLFKELITALTTAEQNRTLLQGSQRLTPMLQRLKKIFDAERILYGGDTTVTDSEGHAREISGIAGRKAAAYRNVATELVRSDAVISTALLNRVLSQYELRWPEPQVPFTQPALKEGVAQIIAARALPLAQLSDDVGDGLSRSLGNLIALHEQLAANKPLTFGELLTHAAAVQVWLDQLKATSIPTNFFRDFLKVLQGGAVP